MSQASAFHALHTGPEVLVLPNAWDAASAAVMEDAGARAVATSSAAVAWAHGYADGDVLPRAALLTTLTEIVRVIKVPLTADIEGGYTDDLAELAEVTAAVIGTGVVGINLEDGARDPDLHARKVEAVRAAAVKAGVDLFINARTDIYLRGLAEGEAAKAETLRRAALYGAAGASGVFVPGASDNGLIADLADGVALPLNIMGWAGVASAAELARLGVRRLSSATTPFRAAYATLGRAMAEYLASGDPAPLVALGAGAPDLNARFG